MEPASGESCPPGQHRGLSAPGNKRVPSPDHVSFHTYSTPTTRGRKRISPRSIPPRTVWKPQRYRLICGWLGLMEPAHRENYPPRQRRGLTAPGDDEVTSSVQKSFHTSTKPTNPGRKRSSPGSISPRKIWKSHRHGLILDGRAHGASPRRGLPHGRRSRCHRTPRR